MYGRQLHTIAQTAVDNDAIYSGEERAASAPLAFRSTFLLSCGMSRRLLYGLDLSERAAHATVPQNAYQQEEMGGF